jgi:hypothetical protein
MMMSAMLTIRMAAMEVTKTRVMTRTPNWSSTRLQQAQGARDSRQHTLCQHTGSRQ